MYYDGANWVYDKKEDKSMQWTEWACLTDTQRIAHLFERIRKLESLHEPAYPRPAEKRKLWKLLSQYSNWQLPELSKIVIDEICEEIENVNFDHLFDDRSKKEKIKAHLKETLL